MALCYLGMCADSLESYEWEVCVSALLSHKNADIEKEHSICIDATLYVPLNHC